MDDAFKNLELSTNWSTWIISGVGVAEERPFVGHPIQVKVNHLVICQSKKKPIAMRE